MRPHRTLFSQHPLVPLAIAFSVGVSAANYLPARFANLVTAGAVSSALALFLVIKGRVALAGVALLLAMFSTGVVLAELERRANDSSEIRRLVEQSGNVSLTLTGWLDSPPEFARDRVFLSMRVENVTGRVWLLAPLRDATRAGEFSALQLRYGSRVRVATSLDRTGNYRNPGVSTLAGFLDRNGYDASGIIRTPASIVRLDERRTFPLLAALYDWRARLQQQIDTHFAPETAGVLDASLLGNRYNLLPNASERFREGGTFHVLVISGLHITFIGTIVLLIVRRLTRRRLVQFLLPALIVWAYSIAVGTDASVVRAALMFTFAGLGAIVFRPATSLNALGGAALVLLVQSPKEIFDPSFQLTFLSVLAIVALAWPLLLRMQAIGAWHPTRSTPHPPSCSRPFKTLCELLFWREQQWQQELARSSHDYRLFKATAASWFECWHVQPFLRYTFGAVVVSASVQVVLLPLMIVYFHRITLSSLVLNIVVSVLLAALIAVALGSLLIAQLNLAVAEPLFKLADGINWLLVHSVDPFSGVGSFRLPQYSGTGRFLYALYYVPMLLLLVLLSRWNPLAVLKERQRLFAPACVIQTFLALVLVLHPLSSDRADGKLQVVFLDVGQGDAALITTPDGTTLLIDGGGNTTETARRIGETVVSEYLWWRGLSKIDYLLVTHADADHIDGLNDVLKNFSVRGALVARSPADDPEFSRFSQTVAANHTPIVTIHAGDVIQLGALKVSVLWPPVGGDTSTNNDSIVLRLQFGERSILFTGDIEESAERSLVGSQTQLNVDVVKVAHHGSKTSSTEPFVVATKPALAIISVGRNSRFGHPHKEVVERWQANGVTVLTTGNCGTITLTTDGHELSLQRFIAADKR